VGRAYLPEDCEQARKACPASEPKDITKRAYIRALKRRGFTPDLVTEFREICRSTKGHGEAGRVLACVPRFRARSANSERERGYVEGSDGHFAEFPDRERANPEAPTGRLPICVPCHVEPAVLDRPPRGSSRHGHSDDARVDGHSHGCSHLLRSAGPGGAVYQLANGQLAENADADPERVERIGGLPGARQAMIRRRERVRCRLQRLGVFRRYARSRGRCDRHGR